MIWIKKLLARWRVWRYNYEMTKSFPDPFVVCTHARTCAHVDGMICLPRTCDMRSGKRKQWARDEEAERLCKTEDHLNDTGKDDAHE